MPFPLVPSHNNNSNNTRVTNRMHPSNETVLNQLPLPLPLPSTLTLSRNQLPLPPLLNNQSPASALAPVNLSSSAPSLSFLLPLLEEKKNYLNNEQNDDNNNTLEMLQVKNPKAINDTVYINGSAKRGEKESRILKTIHKTMYTATPQNQ